MVLPRRVAASRQRCVSLVQSVHGQLPTSSLLPPLAWLSRNHAKVHQIKEHKLAFPPVRSITTRDLQRPKT